MNRIRVCAVAGIAGWMLLTGGAVAGAQATGSSAVGGVGQIELTVQADGAGANCDVRVDGNIVPNSQFLVFADPGVASKVVSPIAGGPHTVNAFCNGVDLDPIQVQVQPGPGGSA
ncbi:hypothetical protein [Nocardia sp. NPDC020380]|uniref:hypothetical protein n=1 Tax=Nocardia sp. NPDC020380 TaxID=3364309 RepID=UPI0037AE4CD4